MVWVSRLVLGHGVNCLSNRLPAITAAGLAGCSLYISETLAGRDPTPELLTAGLPNGRIRHAEVVRHMGSSPCIRLILLDQHDGTEHERLMDPEAFLVIRLLQLPKIDIRLDHSQKASQRKARELHYVVMLGSITVARLIADVPAGRMVNLRGDHHDLRRQNLRHVDAKPSSSQNHVHQTRDAALAIALAAFDVALAKGRLDHLPPMNREQYRWLIEMSFLLLDRLTSSSKVLS